MTKRNVTNATKTDVLSGTGVSGNGILDDAILELRRWGTRTSYKLDPGKAPIIVGRKAECDIHIEDDLHHTSGVHAELDVIDGCWWVTNRSKNGTKFDGEKRPACALSPGIEIEIAGTKFVAESARLIRLRSALARMIGWHERHYEAIDVALNEIRLATARRAILVLYGQPHLSTVAAELHTLTMGDNRPFVLCRLSRPRDTEDLKAPSFTSALAALEAAHGGTVCLSGKAPRDLRDMLLKMRGPGCHTQLVVCGDTAKDGPLYQARPVEITPLTYRAKELDDLIDEYAVTAKTELKLAQFKLTSAEREWIKNSSSASLSDIQASTKRLALIRREGSIPAAAKALGVARKVLWKWFDRRNFRDYFPNAEK